MAYEIATDEPLGEGLRRSAREQLEGATEALEQKIAKDPGKAIHDARKRLKRTRALLRLARPVLGAKLARRENATLRDAAASLAAARDAEVMVQTVDALAERYVGRLPASTFDAIRSSLAPADGDAAPVPSTAAALEGIGRVRATLEDWPLGDASAEDVLAGESVAYAAGRAQLPRAGDRPSADELHEWRKRVKDLWYHGQLLQNAWPAVMEAQAEEAHVLSETLGNDHDLAVLRERVAAGVDDPTADVDGFLELVDRRREELLDDALALGRRVYAEAPKAHAKRLRRYVQTWQEDAAVSA
jgi:CHAD domain-containing protein